jgi:hypothetical protein
MRVLDAGGLAEGEEGGGGGGGGEGGEGGGGMADGRGLGGKEMGGGGVDEEQDTLLTVEEWEAQVHPNPKTLNPKTNPKLETRNARSETQNQRPETPKPKAKVLTLG